MSTSRAVRLTTIGGIEIRLAPSLLLVVAAVIWTFTGRFQPAHGQLVAAVMATVFAVLFFATILAHELAHALEARHRDIEVHGITLLLFGGVTEMHAHGQHPRDEFAIAAVGPYVSVLCAAVFGLIATFAADLLPATAARPVADVAGLLGWWNLLLAGFNLVPGAPLDGGRVLRAVLWWMLGDRLRALRIAVRAGQLLGVALGLFGAVVLLRGLDAIGQGAQLGRGAVFVGPLLFAVLGAFLFAAARSELRHAELEAALQGRTVAALLGTRPDPLPVDARLDGLDLVARAGGTALLPVVGPEGIVGVLDVAAVQAMHPADRSVRTAGELADAIDGLPAVRLDDDLHTLVERFQGEHHVVRVERDGGDVVGALTEREAALALARLRRESRR